MTTMPPAHYFRLLHEDLTDPAQIEDALRASLNANKNYTIMSIEPHTRGGIALHVSLHSNIKPETLVNALVSANFILAI